MPPEAELRIELLGGFRVVAGGRAVDEGAWRLRRSRSLVKLLALAHEHRLHREQVVAALWPDRDVGAAANNLRGAMSRVPADATAYGHRGAGFLLNAIGMWPDPADTQRNTAWVRALASAVEPHARGAYVNFMGEEGADRVRAAYEPGAFARLQALKAQYDPTNFFRLNQNVPPAAATPG